VLLPDAALCGVGLDLVDLAAVVFLEEVENFRRHHPKVMERLGIEIEVRFRGEPE
jgi:hypothetical protein